MIKNILRKIRLFPLRRKEPYLSFYNVLGFYPDDISYYQLAVRHSSVALPSKTGVSLSNERLEFLGDAVLNSVISDILYHRYENRREGFLTNMRSKIVNRDSMNQLAKKIGLDKLVLTSRQITPNTNVDGNALEALIGAVYLDFGYEKSRQFIEHRLLENLLPFENIEKKEINYKSKIIEWCQRRRYQIDFVLLSETLDQHHQHTFTMQLLIDNHVISEAMGSSKKEAQQNAAKIAYKRMKATPKLIDELNAVDNEL